MSIKTKVGISSIVLATLAVICFMAARLIEIKFYETRNGLDMFLFCFFDFTAACSTCLAPIQGYRWLFWNDHKT